MVVFVRTNRPFYGRIYALGRSETCHANVLNSQQFRLDLSLGGQDCNTQSLSDVQGGVYTNTVVLQHHNVVLTRADKVYNVRCTYEIASRNVSFGMIPIRDPETVQVTATPETPLPKITILGADAREASTVRIGDKLTFRIEIPEGSPYRIFARSCVAMAKDARSTFEVIDENGCPVEPSIFPRFIQNNNALESTYEAFRFTESYGVIFQCNVKYCIGRCEPVRTPSSYRISDFILIRSLSERCVQVVCGTGPGGRVESYGRRRRRHTGGNDQGSEMTLSREILVLDFKDETSSRALRDRSHSADGRI
ncbi:hypothetical protein LAZ67_10002009 [Cordylochernes scorpioides]|uniref:ZP domain-containing protein n=1 Tax=Cordylochernes scorpioides TaxID=51811 RepID=A0ABY6KWX5_9ARAC|nr:hypothetical protein LAZ67_10002009 [Cordylochernes scorpioides]